MTGATGFDVAVLAYPWSVSERGAARARRDVGESVAWSLAAGYHSLRQLDPLSTTRTVREIPEAQLYWTPSRGSFAGPIRPRPARGELRDAFPRASDALRGSGARVGAWLSVLHSSALAAAHPGEALRTVTGERLAHALCPARPAVVEYAEELVADLLGRGAADFLELEATGYHGWRHDARHDKAAIPVGDELNLLLSVCLCDACAQRIAAEGADPEGVGIRLREALRRALAAPEAAADALAAVPAAELAAVLAARRGAVAELTDRLVSLGRSAGIEVLVHAGPEPLRTGSRAVLDAEAARGLASRPRLVVSTDGLTSGPELQEAVSAATAHYGDSADVLVSRRVQPPDVRAAPELVADLSRARELGAVGVRFHTYGLLNEERLGWIRQAVEAVA